MSDQRPTERRNVRKNVFVVGLDPHNRQVLEASPDAADYRFHTVLSFAEIYGEVISFDDALASAQRVLDAFDGPVDAIIGFWDFRSAHWSRCCANVSDSSPTAWRMW